MAGTAQIWILREGTANIRLRMKISNNWQGIWPPHHQYPSNIDLRWKLKSRDLDRILRFLRSPASTFSRKSWVWTDWFPKQYCFTRKSAKYRISKVPKGFTKCGNRQSAEIYLFSSKTCSISWVACSVNSECEILKINFSYLPLHGIFSTSSKPLKIHYFWTVLLTKRFCKIL